MIQTFRCCNCNQRLFDVKGGEPRTAILIKCPRCGTLSSFDYRKRETTPDDKGSQNPTKDHESHQ